MGDPCVLSSKIGRFCQQMLVRFDYGFATFDRSSGVQRLNNTATMLGEHKWLNRLAHRRNLGGDGKFGHCRLLDFDILFDLAALTRVSIVDQHPDSHLGNLLKR